MPRDIFDPDWSSPDSSALADMRKTLSEVGLSVPVVPTWAVDPLRRSEFGWAWGTDPEISPWAVYSIQGDLFPTPIPLCLEEGRADFWMFGHRGYGANSMGGGLLVRNGPLFIFQQDLWGGGYMDHGAATAAVNRATRTWDRTAARLADRPTEGLRVAVLFSSFRNFGEIWVRDVKARRSRRDPLRPTGWRSLWSLSHRQRFGDLLALRSDDEIVAIAADHLAALLERREGVPKPASGTQTGLDLDSEPFLSSKGTTMNSPPTPATGVPPDEPGAIIGLEELVEAILHPHYNDRDSSAYWNRFVDLTCVVFGLEGRTEWLDQAMREIPSKVLPMEGAMEVPKEIAEGYHAIDDVHARRADMRKQMQQLQREFFRGLLLAIDPTIKRRTTTVGRLRQLGLPERPYTDWDNY